MPGAGAIKAGDAYIEIGTRIGPRFKRGLTGVLRMMTGFRVKMAAIAGTAAAVAGIAAVTNEFAKFENQMAKVATLLDKDVMPLFDQMGDDVRKLSREFGQGTDTLAAGLFDIISATIPAAKSLEVLAAGAKLAAAGVTTTKNATSAILTVMQVFPDEVRNAADAADFLFQVAKRGRTDVALVAQSFGLVASDARGAKLSLIETGAALAALTRGMGGNTPIAITRLRTLVNIFVTKPQKEAAATARELGFELNSLTLKTIGLSGVLRKLSENDATPEQIGRIFTMRRARSAIMVLLEQQTQLQEDLRQAEDRGGATTRGFAAIVKTMAFQMGRLTSIMRSAAVSLGKIFAPAITKLISLFKDVIGDLDEFVAANEELGKSLLDSVGPAIDTIKEKMGDWFDSGDAAKFFGEVVNGFDVLLKATMLFIRGLELAGKTFLSLFQATKKFTETQFAKADVKKAERRKETLEIIQQASPELRRVAIAGRGGRERLPAFAKTKGVTLKHDPTAEILENLRLALRHAKLKKTGETLDDILAEKIRQEEQQIAGFKSELEFIKGKEIGVSFDDLKDAAAKLKEAAADLGKPLAKIGDAPSLEMPVNAVTKSLETLEKELLELQKRMSLMFDPNKAQQAAIKERIKLARAEMDSIGEGLTKGLPAAYVQELRALMRPFANEIKKDTALLKRFTSAGSKEQLKKDIGIKKDEVAAAKAKVPMEQLEKELAVLKTRLFELRPGGPDENPAFNLDRFRAREAVLNKEREIQVRNRAKGITGGPQADPLRAQMNRISAALSKLPTGLAPALRGEFSNLVTGKTFKAGKVDVDLSAFETKIAEAMIPAMPAPFADVLGRGMVGAGALSGATMPELNAADVRQVDQEISLLTQIRDAILGAPEAGVAV